MAAVVAEARTVAEAVVDRTARAVRVADILQVRMRLPRPLRVGVRLPRRAAAIGGIRFMVEVRTRLLPRLEPVE
jgi:hypothetical protein